MYYNMIYFKILVDEKTKIEKWISNQLFDVYSKSEENIFNKLIFK